MEDSPAAGSRSKVLHLKKFGAPKHSPQLSIDSPLYDASEEDNTDDGSSIRVNQPWSRTGQPVSGSSIIQGGRQNYAKGGGAKGGPGPVSATSRLAHVSIDTDSGVDSPTYDGDVEMNTAVPSSKHSTATLSPVSAKGLSLPPNNNSVVGQQQQEEVVESLHNLAGPTITTPSSPVSSLYPDPPSSAGSTPSITDDEKMIGVQTRGSHAPSRKDSNPTSTPFIKPAVLIAPPSSNNVPVLPSYRTTPKAAEQRLPDTAPPDAATGNHSDSDSEGVLVNPSMLSAEDIRTFVQKALDGEGERTYKINPPPQDRPIRVYADGVYDMFHFGHALQLRQAKLSFPSVHLLVGVPNDELCQSHKARTVLSHFERLESVRHCRWTDEVIPDAPWIIDSEFMEKHQIDYIAHDEEPYADSSGLGDIYQPIKELGKFLPTRRTPGISTSGLLERLVSRYRLGDFDGKLEKIGHGELSARGSVYDDSRPASRMSSRPPGPGGLQAASPLPTSLPVHLPPHSPGSENGKRSD